MYSEGTGGLAPVAGKKERQRKLARERHERRLARQAQRERRARVWSIGVTAAVVVIGGTVGGVVFAGRSTGTSTTPKPSATTTAHCTYKANPPAARKVNFPPATASKKASYEATIATNRGPIVIDLLNSKATCTVNSFVSLAKQG